MMKPVKYFILIIVTIICITCKKKTTIKVKLLNPILNEYVSNATIVLVERHKGGIFGGISCKEIATTVTDNNGECLFDKDKLRTNGNYDYYCAVKESWGIPQTYPCGGKTSRFLAKGKTQDLLMTDYADGYLRVQYNNLLNPSQSGDSLIIGISTIGYYDPIVGDVPGGGGVFGNWNYYGESGYPFPAIILSDPVKTIGGKKLVFIRKHKMGVITTSVDTIKVYPNQTTIVQVNW